MSPELTLAALACLLPVLAVLGVGLGVAIGLADGRRNREEASAQAAVLAEAGLVAGEGGWQVGAIGGRAVAVKAVRGAKVDLAAEARRINLGVSLAVLVPLEAQLPGHLYRNNPRETAPSFERLYYGEGGKPVEGVPPKVVEGLVAWALAHPEDRVELAPRSSPHLYAGSQHPDAVSLVRIEGAARAEPAAVRSWLERIVARVEALEG